MKAATFFTLAGLVATTLSQGFQVNTPSVPVECVPTQITWTGGTAPFTLFAYCNIHDSIQTPDANGDILQTYTGITASPFVWQSNISAPIQLGITMRDATGAPAQTGSFLLNGNSDTSCLNAGTGSSDSGSSTASGSSTSESAVSTPSGSSTSASTPGTSSVSAPSVSSTPSASSTPSGASSTSGSTSHSSSSSTSPSGSGSPSPSPTAGGAIANGASAGIVALVGFVVAGLMA